MKLTLEQQAFILSAFNSAKKDADFALEKMDFYSEKVRQADDDIHRRRAEVREARYDSAHSFDLGIMDGISRTLEILGLDLFFNGDDVAVDIEEVTEDPPRFS